MEIKIGEYQVDYWDGIEWRESASFDNKAEAEEEINELLKFYNSHDIRVIGYLDCSG